MKAKVETETKAKVKTLMSHSNNTVLLDFRMIGEQWESSFTRQPTYVWIVRDVFQHTLTTHVFAPMVSTKKHAQTTTFRNVKELSSFLRQHRCALPTDYERVVAEVMREKVGSQRFVVVHEPMLSLNSIQIFLERVKVFSQKGQKDIYTHIVMDTQIDASLFVLELIRAVFDLHDLSTDSLCLARKNTLTHNLSTVHPSVPKEQLQLLWNIIEDATENRDAMCYQEEMYDLLWNIFSSAIHTKHIHFVSQPSFTLLPNSQFGIVQCKHCVSSPMDYLLQDLPTVFTVVSTSTTDYSKAHPGIRALYEDKILPLYNTPSTNVESSLSIDDFYIRAQLNVSNKELLLYQIFHQLHQEETCPLFSIWNDDTIVKRQLIQLRYYEDHLGKQPRVLQAYNKYAMAHESSMKIEQHTERAHIETMDFVLVVDDFFYLFTLSCDGTLTCSPQPFGSFDKHVTDDVEQLFHTFVDRVLPACNAFLANITQLLYIVPHFSNVSPTLFQVHMKYDAQTRCLVCARNVSIASYSGSYRENVIKHAVDNTIERLQHFIIPSSLGRDDNISLQKRVTKHVKQSALQRFCINALLTSTHNDLAPHLIDTNSVLTLLNIHFISRYNLHGNAKNPFLSQLDVIRMNTDDSEVKLSLHTDIKKQYLKNINVHPHCFVTFISLFAQCIRSFVEDSASSSSRTNVIQCSIPFVSSYSDVVLKNMEYIFKKKYIKHKNTAQTKNKYANVCQRPKQPWCVTAPHIHNMRRWCRYACVSAEYDYWHVKAFRDALALLEDTPIYNGPFASKFMNLDKTHNELVHNYCRLIKLTQCKTSHHIISNTFKQLIVTVSELLQNETLDVNTYSMKMVLNNAYDYDKFPKVRTTMLQILKEAYPDEDYNSDFENLPSWAKIFYAVRRFAELFVYLRHPNEQTSTGEDIYYCSPTYICTNCKTPISNPESPEYYYADPVTDADVEEALHYTHKTHNERPIVEASFRTKPCLKTQRVQGNYDYGDLADTHREDLQWVCTPTTPHTPEPNRRLNCPTPYATFGRLYGLPDFKKQTPHNALFVSIHNTLWSVRIDKTTPTLVNVSKWTSALPSKLKHPQTATLYVDGAHHHHLTQDPPAPTWSKVSVKKTPATFQCTIHNVSASTSHVPKHSRCTVDALSTYAVIYNSKKDVSIAHRAHYPLCLRFQQRRAYDPLKSLYIPIRLYKKHASSVRVTLYGGVQFESKKAKQTRKRRQNNKNKSNSTSHRASTPSTPKSSSSSVSTQPSVNVATYSAPLSTMVQRKLVTAVTHSNYVALYLEWQYCRAWEWVMPNKPMFQEVLEMNQKRKTTVYKTDKKEYAEKTFPACQIQSCVATRTMTVNLNDDTHFRCPFCNQANEYRTFRKKERSAYGSIVGIAKPETNVHLDPNWLYVCSFKLLGARIDSSAYASKWKANPTLNAYQYSIPLQQRVQFSNLRTKTFNCGVLKVTTLDTFSLSSLNLDSFFEQSATLTDETFIMTGCKKPGVKDTFSHQSGSLQQLWQLAIEKEITPAWLSTVVTPTMVLTADNGQFINTCKMRHSHHTTTTSNHSKASWSKQHKQAFMDSPRVFGLVCNAYTYLQHALLLDTNLLNTFHLFWHIMTQVGYQLGQQHFSVYYFFFDVCQTETRKNFIPSLICPPIHSHALYWNPYNTPIPHNTIRTHADILLFTLAVKMHCQQSFNDTYYLLRRNKLQLHNQYVQVCYKSRVQYFCDVKPMSIKNVKILYENLQPLQQESEQMFINAYLYYKLFNQASKCTLHHWAPVQNNLLPQHIAPPHELIDCMKRFQFQFHNEYILQPYTLQPTNICFQHQSTSRCIILPVITHCERAMQYKENVQNITFFTLDEAIQLLHRIAKQITSYAPQSVILNTISQAIGVRLLNGGQVQVQPELYLKCKHNLSISQPYTYNTSLMQATPALTQHHTISFIDVWDKFIDICDKIAVKCKGNAVTNIFEQLHKYAHTIPRTHRRQVLELVEEYGDTPIIHNFIKTQSTQALRRYISGVYSHRSQTSENHFFFDAQNYKDNYSTEYRSTSDILFHNMLMKTSSALDQNVTQHTTFLHRSPPPPYNTLLQNTRVLNVDGFKELAHTKNIAKEYLQNKGTTLPEKQCVPLLYRAIYLLNEERFIQPVHNTKSKSKSKNDISMDNSIVMLTRPTLILFDAIYNTNTLLTHQMPACFQCIQQNEKAIHIIVHHNQTTYHTTIVRITPKNQQHELVLKPPLRIGQDQAVRVHLDTEHHQVKHYELLKHRVNDRMKNLQFGQLPQSLQRHNTTPPPPPPPPTKQRAKQQTTHYIVVN